MDEKQIKELYKWMVENGQKQLSKADKELIKKAIDESKSWDELFCTAMMYVVIK